MARASSHVGRNEKPSVSSVGYEGSLAADLSALGASLQGTESVKEQIIRVLFELATQHKRAIAVQEIATSIGKASNSVSCTLCREAALGTVHKVGMGLFFPANVAELQKKYGKKK